MSADAAALAILARRTFCATFSPHNREEDMQAYVAQAFGPAQQARELADPRLLTLLCECDGFLAGYAQLQRDTRPACDVPTGSIELKRFYVEPARHGSGLAARLMATVFDAAREERAEHVWLGVWEHNPRAIAFYLKRGFVDIGSQPFRLGSDVQTDRVMLAAVP